MKIHMNDRDSTVLLPADAVVNDDSFKKMNLNLAGGVGGGEPMVTMVQESECSEATSCSLATTCSSEFSSHGAEMDSVLASSAQQQQQLQPTMMMTVVANNADEDVLQFDCIVCEKNFPSAGQLRKHLRCAHTG